MERIEQLQAKFYQVATQHEIEQYDKFIRSNATNEQIIEYLNEQIRKG